MKNESIISLATPIGNAAIGVIRLSGDNVFEIIKKYFVPFFKLTREEVKPNYTYLGWLKNNNIFLDNVIVIFYKAPKSYTGEDVIEIFAHGGYFNCQKIINELLKEDIRIAEPGEFTKRAFFNNKLDLIQAEAILDLIHSNNDLIHKIAVNNIRGKFSEKIEEIKKKLIEVKSELEADIDFPEENLEINFEKIFKTIIEIKKELEKIVENSERNLIIKNGYNIVISGDTNVGKSSLFNLLLNENRAIVTEIPGTTRDMLKEFFVIDNIPINLFDTAGIRKTENKIEKIGIAKTKEVLNNSDLILLMYDLQIGKTQSFYEIKENYQNVLVIANKIDLVDNFEKDENEIYISVKEQKGIDELYKKIKEMIFTKVNLKDEILTLNIRHINNIKKGIEALENIINQKDFISSEYFIIDLNICISELEDIMGIITTDDVLDKIFSSFCIGK